MKDLRRLVRTVPVHPLLFAVFPLLSFAAHNPDQIVAIDMLTLASISVVLAALVLTIVRLGLGGWRPAAVLTSVLVLLFTSYVPLLDALPPFRLLGIGIGRNRLLLPLTVIGASALALVLFKLRNKLYDLTLILNVVAIGLVLLSIGRVVTPQLRQSRHEIGEPIIPSLSARARAFLPDIYYIVLDGYARADTLRSVYDFDNSAFLQQLTRRGFVVGEGARSNYSMTQLSLASSMNMRYIGDLTERFGRASRSKKPLVSLIQHSQVARSLQSIGYRFVHLGSGWGPTARNEAADRNFDCGRIGEFREKFARTTLLRYSQAAMRVVRGDRGQRERLLCSLATLRKTVPSLPRPQFVFAHIVAPHPPYVVGPKGERVSIPVGDFSFTEWARKKPYVDQIRYLNSQLIPFIDTVMHASAVPPVILLQADHGPFVTMARGSSQVRRNPTDQDVETIMRILSAYLVPGSKMRIAPDTTPVNSFRLVFDTLFGTRLGALPNRSYFSHPNTPYDFADVTERVD